VDWDNPVFAPKERDLMFIGGGIGGAWNDLRESGWVFTGYGSAEIDLIAIAFFRYERIVVDIAEYGHKIFDLNASASDRLSNLRKPRDRVPPGQRYRYGPQVLFEPYLKRQQKNKVKETKLYRRKTAEETALLRIMRSC
jgi:hypothetical protein